MRKKNSATLLLAVLVLAGCGVLSRITAGEGESHEAAEKANAFWRSHIAHCGQSDYVVTPGAPQRYTNVTELRDVSSVMGTYDITEAEKLNGLQWNGYSRLHAKVSRTLTLAVQTPQWGQWINGADISLMMNKKNGQWSVGLWQRGMMETAPTCDWIARLGEGRTPTKTIASHRLGGQWCNEQIVLTLTDVNFTLTFSSGGDPVVVWFWNPSFDSSGLSDVHPVTGSTPTNCGDCELIFSHTRPHTFGDNPIWVKSDRSTLEKVRQEILDAQAEWRQKYPN